MTVEEVLAKIARPVEPFPSKDEPMFYLRGLSAQAKIEMREWAKAHPDTKYYQLLFVNGVVDESGDRILSNDDAPKIAEGAAGTVEDVAIRVMELSGIGKDEPDPKADSATTTTN